MAIAFYCCMKSMNPFFISLYLALLFPFNLWASVPTGETVRMLRNEEKRIGSDAKQLLKDLTEGLEANKDDPHYSVYTNEVHRLKLNFGKSEIPMIQSCLTATPEHVSYVLNRVQGFAYHHHSQEDPEATEVRTQLARIQLLSDQRAEVQSWIRGFQETNLCSQRAESRSP